MQTATVDIVIIGGGVAGLWLLNRLRQRGFSVILLESDTLGGGQTHKAQGIIHGGMKYALQGEVTGATQAISDMPSVWAECLQGRGEIDLKNVPVLSKHQYLWSTGSLTSKLAGFFASLALRGNVQALERAAFPVVFQHAQFKGQVYSLDEMVIDVPALVRELAKPHQDVIFKINASELNNNVKIKAQKYIFTAGEGNKLVSQVQLRPLHMVMVKTDFSYPLYAHCLGLGATPRITITTHTAQDGKNIWYLGGQIAEEGVKYGSDSQCRLVKKELELLFPWLDFSKSQFASFFVNRAEEFQADGKRPDSSSVKEIGDKIIAWPTKLALAPKLANDIIACLNIQSQPSDITALSAWPKPEFAKPIWDQLL